MPRIGLAAVAALAVLLPVACGGAEDGSGATDTPSAEDPPAIDLDWAEILEAAPDPRVVADSDARARLAATGLPWRVRHRASGVELLLVPPGEGLRGAAEGDDLASDDERPAHVVRVERPFYLGRYEVTQEEWQRVIGEPTSHFGGTPRRPVEELDRGQIERFLAATGFTLPTEAQWEYACRAGDSRVRYGELRAIAWYQRTAGMLSHPVGEKPANGFGFHDMLGNVWEWTASPFIADEYRRYAETGVAAEYKPLRGLGVVLRGGSWYDGERRLRASARYAVEWPFEAGHVGFRVARLLPR